MKEEIKEYVQRIKKQYVRDDCIQVMLPYQKDTMTFLNKKGMLYHTKKNSTLYINKYTDDKRKKDFPYHDTPTHIEKRGKQRINYVNQIIEWNTPYIQLSDNTVKELFALKEEKEALLATKILMPIKKDNKIVTQEEIRQIRSLEDKIGIFDKNGAYKLYDFIDEIQILKWYKKKLLNKLENSFPFDYELKEYIYNCIEKSTIRDIPRGLELYDEEDLYISRPNTEKETLEILNHNIRFIEPNKYSVETYEYPITYYTLDHMKELEQKTSKISENTKILRKRKN